MSLIEIITTVYQVKEILNNSKSHPITRNAVQNTWKKLLANREVHMAYLYFFVPTIQYLLEVISFRILFQNPLSGFCVSQVPPKMLPS